MWLCILYLGLWMTKAAILCKTHIFPWIIIPHYSQCNLIKLKICLFPYPLFKNIIHLFFQGLRTLWGVVIVGGRDIWKMKELGGCRIRGAAGGGEGAIIRPNPPQSESEQRPIRHKKMPRTGREIWDRVEFPNKNDPGWNCDGKI